MADLQFFEEGAKNSVAIDRESGDLKMTPKFENAVKMDGKLEIFIFFNVLNRRRSRREGGGGVRDYVFCRTGYQSVHQFYEKSFTKALREKSSFLFSQKKRVSCGCNFLPPKLWTHTEGFLPGFENSDFSIFFLFLEEINRLIRALRAFSEEQKRRLFRYAFEL